MMSAGGKYFERNALTVSVAIALINTNDAIFSLYFDKKKARQRSDDDLIECHTEVSRSESLFMRFLLLFHLPSLMEEDGTFEHELREEVAFHLCWESMFCNPSSQNP